MLALGKLLDLTLAGREPAQKIQLTTGGISLRWLGEGALEVRPSADTDSGLDLLLSAGVHGNETAPIELLDTLVQAIARGQLIPRARILFLFGNPEAMRRGVRYIERDVNRLFNGRHDAVGGNEALRACELERLATTFFSLPQRTRLHYDLHTAIRGSRIEQFALYPWKQGREHSRQELARLQAAGMRAVLLQNKPSITFSAFTYEQLDAEAFTLELGKARPFGHNAEVDLSRLEASLRHLIEGVETDLEQPLDELALFSVRAKSSSTRMPSVCIWTTISRISPNWPPAICWPRTVVSSAGSWKSRGHASSSPTPRLPMACAPAFSSCRRRRPEPQALFCCCCRRRRARTFCTVSATVRAASAPLCRKWLKK